jgi:hypothetical protein
VDTWTRSRGARFSLTSKPTLGSPRGLIGGWGIKDLCPCTGSGSNATQHLEKLHRRTHTRICAHNALVVRKNERIRGVAQWHSMCKALGSIPSTKKFKKMLKIEMSD